MQKRKRIKMDKVFKQASIITVNCWETLQNLFDMLCMQKLSALLILNASDISTSEKNLIDLPARFHCEERTQHFVDRNEEFCNFWMFSPLFIIVTCNPPLDTFQELE